MSCFMLLQDKDPLGIIPMENLCVELVEDPKKPVAIKRGKKGI